MLANETLPFELSEQQVMMLRLLKQSLPEDDFKEMRKLAVQLLAKQLDENVNSCEQENVITTEDYDNLLNNHFRSTSKT